MMMVPEKNHQMFLEAAEGAMRGDAEARAMVGGVIGNYMTGAERQYNLAIKARRGDTGALAQIKAYAGTTDFADLKTPNAAYYQETSEYDMGWMDAFEDVPAQTGKGYFEVATNESTGDWAYVSEGSEPVINKFSGTVVQIPYATYGYSLGWTLQMIQDTQLGVMFDRARDARSKYYAKKRSIHMQLLYDAALQGGTTAYDTTGANALEKDINTLGDAVNDMASELNGLGIGDDLVNAEYLLYSSPRYSRRINRALQETGNTLQSNLQVGRNIRPVYTWASQIPANKAILVLPGRKIKYSTKMEIGVVDTKQSFMTYFEQLGARFGAGIVEVNQCRVVNLT